MTPALPLAIAAGGALGALGRHYVAGSIARWLGMGLPWGTLTVNVVGSLAMGLVVGLVLARIEAGLVWRAFLTTGLLGGFTTFSAFSLETVLLLERGQIASAMAYAGLSVTLCVAAVALGLWVGRL